MLTSWSTTQPRKVDLPVNHPYRKVDLPVNYTTRKVDLLVNYTTRKVDLLVNHIKRQDVVFPGKKKAELQQAPPTLILL